VAVESQKFRDALRKFASGTTIVTVVQNGKPHGMTASSFASASLEPPLVVVLLDVASQTRKILAATGQFAVNILGHDQEWMARAFAEPGEKPFDKLSHRPGLDGIPLIDGAIAWLECNVKEMTNAGDHDIFVGEVLTAESTELPPLIHYDRAYWPFESSS
jgi:flavin reductase (DIM6/NTAB) family NADH-FMN oxidoreductase RutF